MKKILPLGSVVTLHGGKQKIMITTRYPLFNNNGTIGYFDYAACLYPNANTDNQAFFFNEENIESIHFEGYIDDDEELLQKHFKEDEKNIKYPHLKLDDNN